MSILAKLHIDDKEFTILQFRYGITQNADYNGVNPDKNGKPDDRSTPNFWLDMEGKWFELKKNQRAPWMEIAYNELGVEEIAGKKHNVQILEYHKSAGVVDYKNKNSKSKNGIFSQTNR